MPSMSIMEDNAQDNGAELLQALEKLKQMDDNPLPSAKISEENAKVARKAQQVEASKRARIEESRRMAQAMAARTKQRQAAGPALDLAALKEAHANEQLMAATAAEHPDAHVERPPTSLAVVQPAPLVPAVQVDDLPPVQQLLQTYQQLNRTGAAPPTPAAAFHQLLQQPGSLVSCPDEATAQAVFHAACTCQDAAVAAAAFHTFLGWCGVSPAGDSMLQLEYALPYTPSPPISLKWIPAPEDFLLVLQAIGVGSSSSSNNNGSGATAGGGTRGKQQAAKAAKASTSAAAGAEDGAGSSGGAEASYRDGPLRQALVVLSTVYRLVAAGQLPAGARLQEPSVKRLALLLLELHLDPRAALAAPGAAQDALAALVGVLEDVSWSRMGSELATELAAPLGPSHCAAVVVLQQLPCGVPRLAALRQAGALQLIRVLCSQAQAAQGGRQRAVGASIADLKELLQHPGKGAKGSSSKGPPARQLLEVLTDGKGGPDFCTFQKVLSVLEAADALLWAHVEQGGVRPKAVANWWMDYLRGVEQVVRRYAVQAQFVKVRVSELMNVYQELVRDPMDAEEEEEEEEGQE